LDNNWKFNLNSKGERLNEQKLAVVLSVVFTMGSLNHHAPAFADSPAVASTNPIYEKAEKIIIHSTTEPRLQAPMNTLMPLA
jgi:hypothetical protein